MKCKAFLDERVDYSWTARTSLGPDESSKVKVITTGKTVHALWKELVAYANTNVLQEMRRQHPDDVDTWRISHFSAPGPGARGAAHRVSLVRLVLRRLAFGGSTFTDRILQWIDETLVPKHSLSREQTFNKVAATEEDILIYLRTLWSRAEDIPCSADERVAFHCILIMAGTCGFRPGTMMNLKYEQVAMLAVRDPATGRRQLVATITIIHNKQKTGVCRKAQDHRYTFPLFPLPPLAWT